MGEDSSSIATSSIPELEKLDQVLDVVSDNRMKEIENWTGKKFGVYKGYRILKEDICILSHSKGFAAFFPPEFWRKLDHSVPISMSEVDEAECWIAGKNFTFVKFDPGPSEVLFNDFLSDNINTALNRIEAFIHTNFFDNLQAYPESTNFSYGSMIDNPNMFRPFRARLGGEFSFKL